MLTNFFNYLEYNITTETKNGAIAYKTSTNALVDINFQASSLRTYFNINDGFSEDIERKFMEALKEYPIYTIKWLLYLRDIRYGLGEREAFRRFVKCLIINTNVNSAFIKLLNIPEFGRWDDFIDIYFYLVKQKKIDKRLMNIKNFMFHTIKYQLSQDIYSFKYKKIDMSLLAKWLPSESSSSIENSYRAIYLARKLNMSLRTYRKTLSKLRKSLKIIETYMSNNQWNQINYSQVPSKANLLYKNAFLVHDRERRLEFLDSLAKNKTKINSKALFPYEIIYHYKKLIDRNSTSLQETYVYNETLEQMWKSLREYKLLNNTIVIRDGSASMTVNLNKGRATLLDVADAMTIYCTEHSTNKMCKNNFITFSSTPKVINLNSCKTLKDKLDLLKKYDDCSNTNIEKVFDLILKTAIRRKYKQNDLPDSILIISDMQFDCCKANKNTYVLFESIRNKYKRNGYKLPKLIFWNLDQNFSNTIPMQNNDNGLILLSGFSTSLMEMVCSTELDPFKALIKVLDKDRYNYIDKININDYIYKE